MKRCGHRGLMKEAHGPLWRGLGHHRKRGPFACYGTMKISLGPTERNQGGKSGAWPEKKWSRWCGWRGGVRSVRTVGAGAGVGLEGELADLVLDALSLELLLGLTDPRHLRVSVDH